jgi:hypothetical protein
MGLGSMSAGAPSALDAAVVEPREALSAPLTVEAVVPNGTYIGKITGKGTGVDTRGRPFVPDGM